MGKTKLFGFCLNKIRPQAKVGPPTMQIKPEMKNTVKSDNKTEDSKTVDQLKSGSERRKVMIVVDSNKETKVALQWVLSHSVQNDDTITLLHVSKPSKKGNVDEIKNIKSYELVCSLKKVCQTKKPEVHIDVSIVEGEEKGPKIVEESKKQKACLLVLGQKKQSFTWRLIMMWVGNPPVTGDDVVEYCINKADCMTIAVRRKSKKLGGYLLTTKRHKDFWLLA